MERHEWELTYTQWDPSEQPLREALTTLGNGVVATRGAFEEVRAGGPHYPGTYLAGGYNRAESEVAGRVVENEDLVNWPNWLPLSFRCENGDWFDLASVELLDFQLRLELMRGLLVRRVHFRDECGREFRLESRRIVHMGRPNVAALCWELTPLNWSGTLEFRSGLDGDVRNDGVARYAALNGHHHDVIDTGLSGEDTIFLVARTLQSGLVLAQAARTSLFLANGVQRSSIVGDQQVTQHLCVRALEKRPVRLEKIVTLYSSRDFAITDPKTTACNWARRLPGFDELLEEHEAAWRSVWRYTDLKLKSENRYPQMVLRLHLFHLLQTASFHTIDRDVGLPARGLHGEAYRGHIFWDELFAFRLFDLRLPSLTRSLLMYRYRRLNEARHAAQREGYQGAMFPWQSGSDGREETQVLHLNPRSGRWLPDNTHRQRHVGAAIAYNVWQYYETTGDREYLWSQGAELLLEIARFWASLASYSAKHGRYEILGVVGPDEFHTRYPDAERIGTSHLGIDNNAYTNIMATWVLKTALRALDLLPDERRTELLTNLHITDQDLKNWDIISRTMYVPFHGDRIISQFEGWNRLEELDWEGLRQRHGDIRRLDRLLEAEGDDVNRYRAAKQADVLMLFFLLSSDELRELFERLGYAWDDDLIHRNVHYYLKRTSDGSTLSKVVHAWVLARTNRKVSFRLFCEALASDIEDIQGGTTPEGIHIGAMAGTVDLMQRCYTGLTIRKGVLWFDPLLPEGLDQLDMKVRYQEHWLTLQITRQTTTIHVEPGTTTPVHIGHRGKICTIPAGGTCHLQHEQSEEVS